MKLRVLLRKIHHWGSIVIAIPIGVIIIAGFFLQLKKEVDWIQPPSQTGVVQTEVPPTTVEELYTAAASVPEAGINSWEDLERVDFKPDQGIIKFISKSRWEVQVDTYTAEVLQVSYRRSDLIEKIHDGSFFAEWVKLYLFLPSAVVLFVLWMTGLYMFFLPYFKKGKKRKAKNSR